jgi:predicted dehydrogenase
MNLAGYAIDERVALPAVHDYGIGIVGCGGIVNYAHLPAYHANGLRVVACYDRDPEAAARTAAEHGIPTVAASLEAMLADPAVAIVDIAVTPEAQAAIAEQAIAAGKHVLCQKPLASDLAAAARVVDAARRAGVKAAVNQQMRWDAGIRVTGQLLAQGAVGTPGEARIEVSVRTPWHMWPWIAARERLEVMFHSIHYLDTMRGLFGDPEAVTAWHGRWPGQPENGETRTSTVLHYPGDFRAFIDVNHHDWSAEQYARFRVLGTAGSISGTIGALLEYPDGRPDTLAYEAASEPGVRHEAALTLRWIPDAFIGPMASLMEAIQSGVEPATSVADNLGTLRLVEAAYRSAAEGRTVALAEIVAG